MPTNRPDVAELVVAVREFLQEDVRTLLQSLQGSEAERDGAALKKIALNNAIAINLLHVLEREARHRDVQREQEQALLRDFLGQDVGLEVLNTQLIEAIDAGGFDNDNRDLLNLLLQISLGKIAIDNPGYSTAQKYAADRSMQQV